MSGAGRAKLVLRAQEALLGRPTFACLAALNASQWLPRDAVLEIQRQALNRLLASALAHCPWHGARLRAAGLARDIVTGRVGREDLRALPPMTRHDARQHGALMRWSAVPGGAQAYSTGGSSGEPLIFHFGRARQAADAACRLRARSWWGVEPGAREAYLWGAPRELSGADWVKRWRDRLVNHRLFNAFELTPARMDEYLLTLRRWRPASLYGYASSLALFADHLQARGLTQPLPGLKVICTTGEPLLPDQRASIEAAFGVPVANEYGCRDGGLLAHEAPGGALLVMSEHILLELLDADGDPVAPGATGEVVVTNLASVAQPFIRYRTGDFARAAAAPDAAGRGLEVLDEVSGRSTDFVRTADGRVMHALALIYELRAVPGIRKFRCEQFSLDRFRVQLVTGAGWQVASREQIRQQLAARLGATTRIEIDEVPAIPPLPSGKERQVISHLAAPAAPSIWKASS